MKKINNYILTKDQISVVKRIHTQIIMDGLVELELGRKVENEILENSEQNFEKMIEQAQRVLTEMGVMNEIREEILLEEKEEKKAKKRK